MGQKMTSPISASNPAAHRQAFTLVEMLAVIGIIMLLMGTVGWILVLPGLAACFIAFIETIIYLVKSDQSFYEDYVAGDRSWF